MSEAKTQGRVFGVVVILCEIALGLIYGFFVDYSQLTVTTNYLIVITAVILALLGFGMILVYVQQPSILSIAHILIIFAFSLQLYFPIKGMWELIGLSSSKYMLDPQNDTISLLPISLTNDLNDRQSSDQLTQSSIFSWVQCLISLIIAYSAVVGRVGYLEALFLAIFGTIGYTLNQILFWSFYIADCGGAMRIFLYGGMLGLIFGILMSLGNRQSVLDHPDFSSSKHFQTIAFMGSIISFILLPVLNWVDLFHPRPTGLGTDGYVLHTVSLNMWLSLCGSAIGVYCFSIIKFKKLSVHDITYSLFTGGIAYMAMSDLYFNPGVAIGVGTIAGFLSAVTINAKWFMNFNGVIDSSGVLSSFVLPGLLSSILSAIFQANTPLEYGNYQPNFQKTRTNFQNGGYQLAGGALSIAIGIVFALIISFLSRLLNHRQAIDQFHSDNHIILQNSKEQKQIKND